MFDIARIGRDLPVAGVIDRLPKLVDATGRLVIQAPPGTGKTTLVPPALANHCGGKVIVTAPRRVAVRAAARRLRHLSGAPKAVGFSVKGEHQPGTHVEFVTPGVLLQRLLRDPDLEGVSAVAIDEVHERQLDTDLILGMCLELAELRDDFRLVAMSATLERDKLTEFLGAETLSTPAVTYPLDISYRPHPGRSSCSREFLDHLARLAQEQVSATGHSALVFVPGVREVEHVVGRLPGSFPLHGRLDARQQDAALQPSSTPRIVVSTSLAESSLTVPGVRTVIDSGLSRVPRLDASRGMTGLVTISSAKSTADQRAGRAGREGPGTVVRAYSAADYEHAAEAITPEILTTDLTQAALQLASWGDCPLLDSPQPQHLARAREHLESLGALRGGHLTQLGKRLVRLPLDPRLGRALIECGPSAAATVAVLADDPRGDIARQRAPKSESQRLAKLVSTGSGVSDPGAITGLAFPRWISRRVKDDTYLLASGTRACLPHDLGLDGSEWLATAVVTRSAEGGTIRAAARLSEEDALNIIGVTEELETDFVKGKLRARQIRRAGQIELSSTPTQPSPEAAAEALTRLLERTGLEIFHFSDKAQRLFDRLAFLHARLGDPWPNPQKADPQYWLGPELGDIVRGKPPREVDMYPALQRLLPWPNDIDAAAPERLTVPSGKRPRIDYASGRPVVRVKLQECFGLHSSPEIAGLPVQFHLLSPASRPLAVTDDLASFWSGPYQQVRAEMRGRYPKHAWPEDPS
ncbi:ATP-dependent RNA helicase [Corynebacterium confusum]|uniref:ATP-dependent RNA helicase n=1 Tax=Corynebacterium confusum TaxID=71254 RepID=UPI0025B3291D|nr:ATP-dependent helicase C-terminal domain-containing protein [Corynebacterium confusum]WJY88677.1 ATP-dependent RNA helicase HrpB [Corynebacterium confusum]